MSDNLGSLDNLSPGCRQIAIELRRLNIGIVADEETRGIHLNNESGNVTPELIARVRPHVAELIEYIYGRKDRPPGRPRKAK